MAQSNLFNANGRVFVAFPQPGSALEFVYVGDVRIEAIQHAGGSLTPILNSNRIKGALRAQGGLWTGTMVVRVLPGGDSVFRRAHDTDAPLHIRVNYGSCNDPTALTDYTDSFLMREVYITDYSTSALTSAQPSDVGLITETLTFSCLDARFVFGKALAAAGAPFSSAEVVAITTEERQAGSPTSRIYVLLEQAYLSGTPSFTLAWSDNDGLTWSSAALDGTNLAGATAEVCKMVVLGDYLVGLNFGSDEMCLWALDRQRIDAGVNPLSPIMLSGLGTYPGDLKRFGEYAYVPLLDGDIIRIDRNLSVSLVIATGIANCGAFCVLNHDHFIVSTFDGTGSHLYEIQGGASKQIVDSRRDQYVSSIAARPDGYILIAYIYGYVYGKARDQDSLDLLLYTANTDCINQVVMLNELVGYAAGQFIYQTVDGGASWLKLSTQSITPNTYAFVALLADEHRVFAGGKSKTLSPIDYSTYIGVYGANEGILVGAT